MGSSDPLEHDGPFVIEYSVKESRFLDPLRKVNRVPLPSLVLESLPWPSLDNDERENDSETSSKEADTKEDEEEDEIDLGGPLTLRETIDLTGAPDFLVRIPPTIAEDRDFASFVASYRLADGRLVVERVLEVSARRLPPSRRQELMDFAEAV